MVKTGLLVPLLGFAAANLAGFQLGLPLRRGGRAHLDLTGGKTPLNSPVARGDLRGVRVLARGEVAFSMLILLVTAALASLPLARNSIAFRGKASQRPWRCRSSLRTWA